MNEIGEAWLARRVYNHTNVDPYSGLSDPDIRRERVRAAILKHGLAAVVIGKDADGKTRTYSEIFERVYAQPLTDPNSKQG